MFESRSEENCYYLFKIKRGDDEEEARSADKLQHIQYTISYFKMKLSYIEK